MAHGLVGKRRDYTIEFKRRVVKRWRDVCEGEYMTTREELAEAHGVEDSRLRAWITQSNKGQL